MKKKLKNGHPLRPEDRNTDFLENPTEWVDGRDSLFGVYVSIIPFLVLEYFAEVSLDFLPSGVVFPFGFLLFWAFFYTYYRPNYLEGRLSNTEELGFSSIPVVLLGVAVWFIKVTVIGALRQLIRFLGFNDSPRTKPTTITKTHAPIFEEAPKAPPLPTHIQQALDTLGCANTRSWDRIHRRYRELAKKYHPDLNPNITDVGNRFMHYDAAYQVLYKARKKHFF